MIHPRLTTVLACPHCRGQIRAEADKLTCENCASAFKIHHGTAIFLSGSTAVAASDHQSNPIGTEYEAILRKGEELILHIGAGATTVRYPNCIEFEHKIFRHTDVVGDAHHLPFRDATFDRVFAFNVFEHLADPRAAAQEIHRVLKPGGAVAIHTAFLQPLHEEPHHFYNATEYGVRRWFARFEIEDCRVSGNFGPGVMLAFLTSQVLEAARLGGISADEEKIISQSTIAQWADFWNKRGELPPGFGTLQALPQPVQKRVAAGFELLARKPLAP